MGDTKLQQQQDTVSRQSIKAQCFLPAASYSFTSSSSSSCSVHLFYNNFINYLTAQHMRANFSFGNLHIVRDLSLSLSLFLGDIHTILYTIPSACGPGCSFS